MPGRTATTIRDLMHKAAAKIANTKTGKAKKGEETSLSTVRNKATRIVGERGFALPDETKTFGVMIVIISCGY